MFLECIQSIQQSAARCERNAINVLGPVVDDVVRAGRQQHVGPDLNLSQPEPLSELVGVVDVNHGRARRRVWRPVLGGDRTRYGVTQIRRRSQVLQQSGEPPGPVSYTHLRAHETDSYLV